MTALAPINIRYRNPGAGFPKGWYCVADLGDVPENALTPVSLLNMQLVVYRLSDGTAQAVDAYCPHFGAHLASSDGCLRNGRLVCPFHKWEFDGGNGRVVHIPYTDSIPNVSLTLHPTRIVDGIIVVWHDANGGNPDHEPYQSAEYGAAADWIHQRTCAWESTAPFQDLLENLFDTAHFEQLHQTKSTPAIKSLEETGYGLRIIYDVDPGLGTAAPLRRMEFHFTGITNSTHYFEGENWKMLVVSSHTPIDEQRFLQKTRFFVHRSTPDDLRALIGSAMITHYISEIEQDLKVLNFKKHLARPRVCAGDGPIYKYRAYASRFL